ncbi:MAG: helix-turn-helix transcriptional regulator [Myxococcales bacterium]|nr:helix-turn-helix transcriptional regulator [Myxococcales bacterium]
MRSDSLIDLVEAAYATDLDVQQWQEQLTGMMAERWGAGVYSFRYDARDASTFSASGHYGVGVSDELVAGARDFHQVLPADAVNAIFGGGAVVTSLNAVLSTDFSVVRMSEEYGLSYEWPETKFDQLGLRTLDANGQGVTFAMPFDGPFPLSAREQAQWTQVGVHIASAYRMRSTLSAGAEAIGEAVLDSDGRCHHAEGEARASDSREVLRAAARSVIRARGKQQRQDIDESLAIWQGLVSGRWSLVDRFDADGKHFLIAHRNAPAARDPRAFSKREAEVASYLGMGHSNKLIAYTLGLKTSTIASHIASIQRKLGVGTRVDAVRVLAATREADEPDDG